MTVAGAARALAGGLRGRVPETLWLTLVWVLLWRSFSMLTMVSGVLVAVAVIMGMRLPASDERLPWRPWLVVRLVGLLGWQVVVASIEVAYHTVRYGPRARGAVVTVPVATRSHRLATVIACAVSVTPGTLTLGLDERRRVWLVYALGPRDRAGVERARRQTAATQRRVLAAFGSPAELVEAAEVESWSSS
ncbi:MAG: Na+/H+ antiporter subunit E [Pseudonocardia sp.]|jgi:multicomponent Na+:H+ antiporter subunit E